MPKKSVKLAVKKRLTMLGENDSVRSKGTLCSPSELDHGLAVVGSGQAALTPRGKASSSIT